MIKPIIKPKPLQAGDTIGMVMPASGVSQELLERITEGLHGLGYKAKLPANIDKVHGYLAGTDEERAGAFMEIWLDPEVDIVWCIRGGYGSGRLLTYLDFNLIKTHPKIFIGMSDITALHIALGQNSSLVSYLGPNLASLFTGDRPSSEFTHYHCYTFLEGRGDMDFYKYRPVEGEGIEILQEGVGEGVFVGGNLSLIVSLIGTPWQLNTEGAILILEEVNEPPYKIDRMLNQLKLSGMLSSVAGVILGTFEGCHVPATSLSLSTIFNEYFSSKSYPVIRGFPTGHSHNQIILPLQCAARIDTYANTLSLLEPATRSSSITPHC